MSPFLDEFGILRLRSRIINDISGFEKNPVILPHDHKYSELIVSFFHQKFNHQGVATVKNEIRQKYWIPRLSNLVKKTLRQCNVCKVLKTTPQVPIMGNLPLARTTPYVKPFSFCGINYFGPYLVKIGRRREKRYGVLFTCLTIRAIHLELANSLTTDSAIMAIQRMSARRGYPTQLFSDNGTNFRGADKELQAALKEFDQQKFNDKLSIHGIQWNFNPATASHMGGVWERLIRTVKTALKTVLKEEVPNEEVLQTLFLEVENIVNSRPLTEINVDSQEEEALTPNHFLLGPHYNQTEGNVLKNLPTDGSHLKKQWKIVQNLSNKFWTRWIMEYLPTLYTRSKWNEDQEKIKIDDVVIIVDDQNHRNLWLKGKVIAVYPGKDGRIRVADVQTNTGVYRRPVSKLCILQIIHGNEAT
ncbi:hypothetical protein [Wolbachia endosymbiont of Psylliodes chrysocephala]|uniref:hypothetical protein n=1 Tax=Wolbachia endosymbiont of Psylliodes chrysocephala TaxID=2883236 RepID=UPI00209F9B45|nr:hypothetical protein [Wolbachia endosymbiont of Psylliodes chrysocephala]